jgi:putative SOS response-associated peptidase YedK
MCNEYEAPTMEQLDLFAEDLELPDPFDYLREPYSARMFPKYMGPIIARFDTPILRVARWAMLGQNGQIVRVGPKKVPAATQNARTEDIAKKPTYRHAWSNMQTCIIPATAFYEPCYLNDKDEPQEKSVPMRMARRDGKLLAIAGLCERHLQEDAVAPLSYTMLTISGEGHPIMKRMHKPNDEKRSVVLIDHDQAWHWLNVKTEAEMRSFLRPFDPEGIEAVARPRAKKPPETQDAGSLDLPLGGGG